MSPKIKKFIILALVVTLLFIVYSLVSKNDTVNQPLIAGVDNETRLLGAQISQALLRIEQITLDKSIFADRLYQSLQDRSSVIEAEPRGRSNPFAPIGAISSVSIQRPAEETTVPEGTPPATPGQSTPSTQTTTPATPASTTTTTTTSPATTPTSSVTNTQQ